MYSFKRCANPEYFTVKGPGISQYAPGIQVGSEKAAEDICRLLVKAFEAGREDKAKEIRQCLRVRER